MKLTEKLEECSSSVRNIDTSHLPVDSFNMENNPCRSSLSSPAPIRSITIPVLFRSISSPDTIQNLSPCNFGNESGYESSSLDKPE